MSANAVTVVGATGLTVRSALPDYLQIAEILAIDFTNVNVAAATNGGTATALSQFFPGQRQRAVQRKPSMASTPRLTTTATTPPSQVCTTRRGRARRST